MTRVYRNRSEFQGTPQNHPIIYVELALNRIWFAFRSECQRSTLIRVPAQGDSRSSGQHHARNQPASGESPENAFCQHRAELVHSQFSRDAWFRRRQNGQQSWTPQVILLLWGLFYFISLIFLKDSCIQNCSLDIFKVPSYYLIPNLWAESLLPFLFLNNNPF